MDSVGFLDHLAPLPPHSRPLALQLSPRLEVGDVPLDHELHLSLVLAPGQPDPQDRGAAPQRPLYLPPLFNQTKIFCLGTLAFQS